MQHKAIGLNLSYQYNKFGNITAVFENGSLKASYQYDYLNELTREDNAYLNQTVTYSYDNGGNILSKTTYPYTTGSLEGMTGETVTYSYGDSEWKDLLTAYNGQAITYDEIGNPLSYKNGFTFTWKNGRRLATAAANGKSLSFEYDDSGYRTQKKVNGVATDYLLDGDKIVSQIYNNQQIWFDYDAAGTRHAMEYNGNNYYYYYNLQGDVIGLYDSSLNSVVQYTYDSWGKLLSVTGSLAETVGKANPFRYRGYYYDSETELYYLNSRYYDPEVGRFINADGEISDVGGDALEYNLFAYCFNNPTNMDDPIGQWPKWLTGALNVVSGAAQMAAGAALGAFTSWTGIGAVAAGFLIVNGAATATQGIGQIVNGVSKSKVMREDNVVRTGTKKVGKAVGGKKGEKLAGVIYDSAAVAANLYAGKVGLQQTGLAPIKVNIDKILNNPLDEFVTCGPAPGVISDYCHSIPLNGYGKIYATQLPNGFYQLANGHHRVAALRSLGKETIKIFLTK